VQFERLAYSCIFQFRSRGGKPGREGGVRIGLQFGAVGENILNPLGTSGAREEETGAATYWTCIKKPKTPTRQGEGVEKREFSSKKGETWEEKGRRKTRAAGREEGKKRNSHLLIGEKQRKLTLGESGGRKCQKSELEEGKS